MKSVQFCIENTFSYNETKGRSISLKDHPDHFPGMRSCALIDCQPGFHFGLRREQLDSPGSAQSRR